MSELEQKPEPHHPSLIHDIKRLSRYASVLGAALAVLCHLLPPHYRAICDALAELCKGESP